MPFTIKSDLQDSYPYGLVGSSKENLVRLNVSGGIAAAYTKEDIEMWTGAMKRCLLCAGVDKNDIIQNFGGLGVNYGIEALGATLVPAEGSSSKGQIKLMKELGTTGVFCTPSYFNFIVEQAVEMGY